MQEEETQNAPVTLVQDTIEQEDLEALSDWLRTGPRLTKGPITVQLEQEWAQMVGTKYSVFVNSGSSAILLVLAALKQMGRLRNNKVVVPALSWATDVSSPMLLGLEPIICDCNLTDLSCDLDQLVKIFQEQRPAALLLVSPLGLVPQMRRLQGLCHSYGVLLIEDVCESMGSKQDGQWLGSFGVASVFSTYFGHHISTIEGGFINTSDLELYEALIMMRSHGWDRDLSPTKQQQLREEHKISDFDALYTFYVPGFNLRSTDLQAFLGRRAIRKLQTWSQVRARNFVTYMCELKSNRLPLQTHPSDTISSFAIPVLHEKRAEIVVALREAGIDCRPLIAGNMAHQPMCARLKHKYPTPNAERIHQYGFYIPNHQHLTTLTIERICKLINSFR